MSEILGPVGGLPHGHEYRPHEVKLAVVETKTLNIFQRAQASIGAFFSRAKQGDAKSSVKRLDGIVSLIHIKPSLSVDDLERALNEFPSDIPEAGVEKRDGPSTSDPEDAVSGMFSDAEVEAGLTEPDDAVSEMFSSFEEPNILEDSGSENEPSRVLPSRDPLSAEPREEPESILPRDSKIVGSDDPAAIEPSKKNTGIPSDRTQTPGRGASSEDMAAVSSPSARTTAKASSTPPLKAVSEDAAASAGSAAKRATDSKKAGASAHSKGSSNPHVAAFESLRDEFAVANESGRSATNLASKQLSSARGDPRSLSAVRTDKLAARSMHAQSLADIANEASSTVFDATKDLGTIFSRSDKDRADALTKDQIDTLSLARAANAAGGIFREYMIGSSAPSAAERRAVETRKLLDLGIRESPFKRAMAVLFATRAFDPINVLNTIFSTTPKADVELSLALQGAISDGNIQLVNQLLFALDRHSSPLKTEMDSKSRVFLAMKLAGSMKADDIVFHILAKVSFADRKELYTMALHDAASTGDSELVAQLLENQERLGMGYEQIENVFSLADKLGTREQIDRMIRLS